MQTNKDNTPARTLKQAQTGLICVETIKEALRLPQAKHVAPEVLKCATLEIIAEAFRRCGREIDVQDLQTEAFYLEEAIQRDFRTLTLAEVRIAMLKGLQGEYGEWFGLNYQTFFLWLKSYCASEQKRRTERQLKAEKQTQNDSRADGVSPPDMKASTITAYRFYADYGVLLYPGSLYGYLVRIGQISLSPIQKNEIKDFVPQYIDAKYRSNAKCDRESFETAQQEKQKAADDTKSFDGWCKEIAVERYFAEVKEFGIDLAEVLKDEKHD